MSAPTNSAEELATIVLRRHQQRLQNLLSEEAAVLARCKLLEELILLAEQQQQLAPPRVHPEASPVLRSLPPGSTAPSAPFTARHFLHTADGGPVKRERDEVARTVADSGESHARLSARLHSPSSAATAAATAIAARLRCDVELSHSPHARPLPSSPQKHVSPSAREVIVVADEQADHDACLPLSDNPPCTPSEILDECELLFGGGTAVQLQPATNAAAAGKTHAPLSLVEPSKVRGAISGNAKQALRSALLMKKERHPRALVRPLTTTTASHNRSSAHGAGSGGGVALVHVESPPEEEVVDHRDGAATTKTTTTLSDHPRQTPDAFWDVTM